MKDKPMTGVIRNLEVSVPTAAESDAFVTVSLRAPAAANSEENWDRDQHSVRGALRRLKLGIDELERFIGVDNDTGTEKITALRESLETLEDYSTTLLGLLGRGLGHDT